MAAYTNQNDPEKNSPIMDNAGISIEKVFSKPIRTASVVANPMPLGLMGFALTMFVLSCHNAGFLVSLAAPHTIVTGLAVIYGGLAMLLAGMWEFHAGNTFGATVFSSYGAFWLSFAVILIPGFGVQQAFATTNTLPDFNEALGVWLLGWTIFTLMVLVCTLRTNACLVGLFASCSIMLILLTVGTFKEDVDVIKSSGVLGIVSAFIGWYLALALLVNKQNSFFELPVGQFPRPAEL